MRLWLLVLVVPALLLLARAEDRFVPFTVARPDGIQWKRPRNAEAKATVQEGSIINVPTNCPTNYIKVVNRCRRLY